ncbi:VOC family protein [Halalkalicoccus sp. NIPERK01]|uniref:VOC family protein n=1 Tax=Halalkalicoccus sp. NIPERK01 TaxID=3053469 RepID=UPI00256F3B04|nr:VOC family protein [Halalkalicoccus sp. NIPERK01]MDL5363816.1 VOC family protein [Halalkalicoccus sp. NIPERK01]
MVEQIDHIGVLVEDITSSRGIYEQLGIELVKTERVPEFGVEIAFMSNGTELIELVEPLADDEFTQLLVEQDHSGFLHHIAFRVEDIEGVLEDLKRAGIGLRDPAPRQGAGGASVAFLEQAAGNGVNIELVERDEEVI